MPTVLITPERLRDQPGPHLDLLRDAGFDVQFPGNPLLARGLCSDEETIEELKNIDATLASTENYNQTVLAALPELKVIARTGVGYDRVDVPFATERRVAVCITPNSNHEAVAEVALGLMFATSKAVVQNDKRVRAGEWPRDILMPIRGRTLGIFGLGRIGRSTAIRAQSLGMRVIATEQFPDTAFVSERGIELVEFDQLLERSDYLTIHAPLTDETRGLFNRDVFRKMKSGSVLINTARGPLVVEKDLCEFLQSGHLRAAGLDVFEREPPEGDNPLFTLDNVVLSPHLAGADETSSVAMSVEAADNIVKLSKHEWPVGAVINHVLQDNWSWER